MPSPFPGMDPYLEQHWGDVHSSLVLYARDQIQPILPDNLRARVEERLIVAALAGARSIYPDVRVFAKKKKKPQRPSDNGGLAVSVAEPVVIELPNEMETQRVLEIRDTSAKSRLITVIEVISPANKMSGNGREQYVKKQKEVLSSDVSLVEIDLLRAGDWTVAAPTEVLSPRERTPYRAVVNRSWDRRKIEYYPLPLTEKLPAIRIPLRPTDADVPLDLQALIDKGYEMGSYDDIDYNESPKPPLKGADARWAAQLLRKAGLRRAAKRK